MPKFEKLTLPSEGEIITFDRGKPNIPNNPIVPWTKVYACIWKIFPKQSCSGSNFIGYFNITYI